MKICIIVISFLISLNALFPLNVSADSTSAKSLLTQEFYSQFSSLLDTYTPEKSLQILLEENFFTPGLSYETYLEIVNLLNQFLSSKGLVLQPLTSEAFPGIKQKSLNFVANQFLLSSNPELRAFESTPDVFDPGEFSLYPEYLNRCKFVPAEYPSPGDEKVDPRVLNCLRTHYLEDLLNRSSACEPRAYRYEKQTDSIFIPAILEAKKRSPLSDRLDDVDLEAALAVKRLFYLNNNNPIYENKPLKVKARNSFPFSRSFTYLRIMGASVSYPNSLLGIFCTLKKFPGLVRKVNGSLVFHGSTSASLLAFTQYSGEDRGNLVPTGVLLQSNRVPFGGQLNQGLSDVNKRHISTLFFDLLSFVLHYSGAELTEKNQIVIRNHFGWHPGKPIGISDHVPGEIREKIIRGRYSDWTKLNVLEKELVREGFPILYGLRLEDTAHDRYQATRASFRHEIGLLNGAKRDEIKVVFVPKNRIHLVKEMLHPYQIRVEELENISCLSRDNTVQD